MKTAVCNSVSLREELPPTPVKSINWVLKSDLPSAGSQSGACRQMARAWRLLACHPLLLYAQAGEPGLRVLPVPFCLPLCTFLFLLSAATRSFQPHSHLAIQDAITQPSHSALYSKQRATGLGARLHWQRTTTFWTLNAPGEIHFKMGKGGRCYELPKN